MKDPLPHKKQEPPGEEAGDLMTNHECFRFLRKCMYTSQHIFNQLLCQAQFMDRKLVNFYIYMCAVVQIYPIFKATLILIA